MGLSLDFQWIASLAFFRVVQNILISLIFILNSKIALVFETEMLN